MTHQKLKVTFLGTGDSFGHGGRLQACFLVDDGQSRLLLDCGASAMISMQRYGVDPNTIAAIVISHLHGDHFCGLPFFILDAQLHSKRASPLIIAGPKGTGARLSQAMEVMFPKSSTVKRKFQVEVVELEPGEIFSCAGFNITQAIGLHPSGAPALALRLERGGKVIAYTGDTQWTDDLLPALRGADLLIAEAYFYEKPIKFHLTYMALAGHLAEIKAGRVLLTHMSQDMLDRLDEVEVEAAEDGMAVEV